MWTQNQLMEFIWLTIMVGGIILALLTGSAIMFYIISLLTGAIFGRIWYETRKQLQFKYLIMMVAFILGYILGNYLTRYGNPSLTVLFFILGIVLSYYLHQKKVVHAVDY